MGAALEAPLIRYHGGKWRLAEDIVALMPAHERYIEPFGGGASVLLRKPLPRAPAGELYNDLEGAIANLFAVLREARATETLERAVCLTPYSREEFRLAYEVSEDPIERARRTLDRAYMGLGTDAASGAPSGLRVELGDAQPAKVWARVPERIAAVAARFAGVIVECRDALEVIGANDDPNALFYIDPPHLAETRSKQAPCKGYRHELGEADHRRLLELLCSLKARVIVSGYRSALYERTLAHWRRLEFGAVAHGGLARIECVWLSPNCESPQASLF